MKAAVYREHNKDPRKVVKIEDIEIPKIKDNQVLIKFEDMVMGHINCSES